MAPSREKYIWISLTKKNPMNDKNNTQNFADFIKEKRTSKNISLERLSELTKIQVYHLEALELGEFEKLPPLVYRAGIFKRLAKFLVIDEIEILEAYQKETSKPDFGASLNSYNYPIVRKKSYFILTPNKLIFFLGAALLLLFSYYLWYQFNFLVGPPNLAIEPKEDIVTKNEIILINGKTDIGVDLTVNGENVYVASGGIFKKEIKLADGVNLIEIAAVNGFGKTKKIIRKIFKEAEIIN